LKIKLITGWIWPNTISIHTRAMLDRGRYLYVGFMYHQVIEKSIKAYFWNSQHEEPPYTHNLLILASKSNLTEHINEDMKI
jgi:HEPN domain-containing protein